MNRMNQRRRRQQADDAAAAASGQKFQEIFDFINDGNWRKVRKLLKHYTKRNILATVTDNTGLTPLAYAISCRAPQDVIETMLRGDPESSMKTDKYGACPLHLACLNGTTYDAVKFILDFDNCRSVRILDNSNCSILHHAVEYACLIIEAKYTHNNSSSGHGHNNGDLSSSGYSGHGNHHPRSIATSRFTDCTIFTDEDQDQYMEIIQLLCNVAPDLVYSVGINGDTPLDIPNIILVKRSDPKYRSSRNIDREAERDMERELMQVYRILKKTGVKLYLKRKAEWESQNFFVGPDNKSQYGRGSLVSSSKSSTMSSQASSITSAHTSFQMSHNISLFKDSVATEFSSGMDMGISMAMRGMNLTADEPLLEDET